MLIWRGGYSRTANKMMLGMIDALIDAAGESRRPLATGDLTREFLSERYDSTLLYAGGADGVTSPLFASHPDFRVVFVLRDPREAMASLRRISHFEPDWGLEWIGSCQEIADFFMTLPDRTCLKLRYETDVADTENLARTLCSFLDLHVSGSDHRRVGAMFRRDAVQRFIERYQTDFFSTFKRFRRRQDDEEADRVRFPLHRGDEILWYAIPRAAVAYDGDTGLLTVDRAALDVGAGLYSFRRNMDGSFRLALPMGLQQDHIGGANAPSWREGLSDAQVSSLNKTLGPWLDKYGYSRDPDVVAAASLGHDRSERNGYP